MILAVIVHGDVPVANEKREKEGGRHRKRVSCYL